jgi:hypothetical protein
MESTVACTLFGISCIYTSVVVAARVPEHALHVLHRTFLLGQRRNCYDPHESNGLLGNAGSETSELGLPESDDDRTQQFHQATSGDPAHSVNHDSFGAPTTRLF